MCLYVSFIDVNVLACASVDLQLESWSCVCLFIYLLFNLQLMDSSNLIQSSHGIQQ